MKLQKDNVLTIAKLAKLNLSESEITFYQSYLETILKYFSVIEKVTVSAPSENVIGEKPEPVKAREDKAKPFMEIEAVLAQSPEHSGNLFKVPRIFE